jgi:hypothetical protein
LPPPPPHPPNPDPLFYFLGPDPPLEPIYI